VRLQICCVGPPTPTVGWRLAVGGLVSPVSPRTNLNNPTKKSNCGIGDRASLSGQRFATLLEKSSLVTPANGGGFHGPARRHDSFPQRRQLPDPAIGEACRLGESIDPLIRWSQLWADIDGTSLRPPTRHKKVASFCCPRP
jgi:hypothetical protein